MRFLSYCLVFAFAFAVTTAPTKIQAQQVDDDIIHISAVSVPSVITDSDAITNLPIDVLDQADDDDGIINAPTLLHSQDELSSIDDVDSPIISTVTPMTVAAEGTEDDDDDHLPLTSSDESLTIDSDDIQPLTDDNEDPQPNELVARTDEELTENGIDALFQSMGEPSINDDENDAIDTQNDVDIDDDDQESFEISAADAESESHEYRRLRRPYRGKRLAKYGMAKRLKGKYEKKTLKLLVLAKKLKALDMKMKLMKLLTRAIKLRMQERLVKGMFQAPTLLALHRKLMKKLMLLKMVKLMHLASYRLMGFPVYSPSGLRISPRFLLRQIIRSALRSPSLTKMFLRLKLKSLMMTTAMKSFVRKMKMLVKKLYLLKKASMGAVNKHRLFVRADRAIVNLGDANEFKPVFYKSRQGARISEDDNRTPVNVRVIQPSLAGFTRRFSPYGDDL